MEQVALAPERCVAVVSCPSDRKIEHVGISGVCARKSAARLAAQPPGLSGADPNERVDAVYLLRTFVVGVHRSKGARDGRDRLTLYATRRLRRGAFFHVAAICLSLERRI